MRHLKLSISIIFILFSFHSTTLAQCVDGAAGGNPNLIDNGDGTYQIACDQGNVNISSTTYDPGVVPPSAIQWTSGQTGDFVFMPDCNNLGCSSFTPCIPAGTAIPQQCVPFSSLGVPLSGSGNNFNIAFTISGICYVPGTTYSGDLGISLGGSGDVSLSVIQPDGVTQGPLTFDISLINALSPLPLSLLGLDVDPNGNWSIVISGNGLTSYTIDPNSEICLDATTTVGVQCSDPIEVCVVGGCPAFGSASVSVSEICSGDSFTLDATVTPADATNVTYAWTGTGINAGNQNSASPTVTVSNMTCAAVTENYTVTATCTNNGSVIGSQTVSVTVYPEIDPIGVVIDNTSNINDPNCSIDISYPACPGFSISGNTIFSPGDNGTTVTYTISNGNPACDITVSSLVNCVGDCTPADATVLVSACDANGDFTIDVIINNMGNSNSLDIILSNGLSQLGVTAPGTYTFGPYPSGTPINIKLIDAADPNCNVNLGEYTQNCFDCPNLTTLNVIPSDVCSGDVITLAANVDQGTEGTDYSIQWFENGVAIAGANTATYAHTASATDPCNLSTYTYSAELTCLNNGLASTTSTLSLAPVNVYPVPQVNIDFVFENCSATPIDNCGNLLIDIGGATDPAPGGFSIVNYTVSVPGAPASCEATGTMTVNCPNCSDYPGNATATETVLCWGESFDVANTNALVSSLGYEVGYVVTPNPPSAYPSTSALLAASLNGPNGAFAAPGAITPDTYTNDGSLFTPSDPCGELLYFTPFLSFACQSYTAINESGSVFTTNADGITVPGVGGTTLSVPQVPFCTGLVNYNIRVCAEDQNTDGEEPLAEDAFFGLIGGLPGGIYSAFPNIDDVHNSGGSPTCYNQNGWTSNPSGEQISITTVNLVTLPFTSDTDRLDWDFVVDVNCNSTFPTVCADCDVLGAPIAVRFLPQTTLPTIPTPAPFCEGETIDLHALNPTPSPNGNGKFTWFGPGGAINDPTSVTPPVGNTQYCLVYDYCEMSDCNSEVCVNLIVIPEPALTPPVFPAICPGEAFDLTSVENSIATGGVFTWSVGNALNSGGAAIFSPTSVIPIASEQYCAQFTDVSTGCSNTVCSTFSYEELPVLLTTAPEICEGNDLQLNDYNADLTTDTGVFTWYDNDPANGGNIIANTLFSPYDPATDGTTFWAEFTDAATGCMAVTSIDVSTDPCCASVDLDIRFDGFPAQTSWDITDANGNAVASSGGTYSGQLGNSLLNLTPACLPDGCYDLNFYDSVNNGMCPFQSNASSLGTFITPGTLITPGTIVATLGSVVSPGLCGNYQLYDASGTLLTSGGGGFGASESNNFCLVNGVAPRLPGTEEGGLVYEDKPRVIGTPDLDVYPNPATDFITVHHRTDYDTEIRIVDMNGRILQQYSRDKNADPIFTLGISDIPIGVNFVQLITAEGTVMTKKFLKQ